MYFYFLFLELQQVQLQINRFLQFWCGYGDNNNVTNQKDLMTFCSMIWMQIFTLELVRQHRRFPPRKDMWIWELILYAWLQFTTTLMPAYVLTYIHTHLSVLSLLPLHVLETRAQIAITHVMILLLTVALELRISFFSFQDEIDGAKRYKRKNLSNKTSVATCHNAVL